ncbi:MAG: hypothetical protein OEV92_13145, partial [Nitrospinota bacterium]|nr:hypothetical protein [Nitrospinota bacterium]
MSFKFVSLVVIQFLVFSQLLCVDAMAAKAIGATARFVKGQAFYVTDSGKSPKRPIKLGTPFAEGDRIYTGPNGRVEVGFDTGGLILIDSKSEFAFGPKKVEDSGTFSAMISLVVGRIKSSVSKR